MKIDMKTAIWLVDKMQNDRSVFPIGFEECPACGAMYLPMLEHRCDRTIEVTSHEVEDPEIMN